MLARYGVMVKAGQAALNPKGMPEGRSMLLEGAAPEWDVYGISVCDGDYSREMRVDRATPKKHRKAVHVRGRDRRWSMYVTGAGTRF